MQIRRNISTQQRKEGADRKRLVTIPQSFEIDRMTIVVEGEEGDDGVDGDHEEDADDVSLFPGARVVEGMLEDEVEGYGDGDQAEDGA